MWRKYDRCVNTGSWVRSGVMNPKVLLLRAARGIALALALLILAPPATAEIIEWRRMHQFTTGGSNPAGDGFGNSVWQYEWMTGDALSGTDPWWDNATTLMVWDPDWWGRGVGAWSRGDNLSPMVNHTLLTHNLYTISHPYMPLVRWTNPFAGDTDFSIGGLLRVVWNGPGFVGSDTLVDVVLAHQDGSTGTKSILSSWTVAKPTPGDSVLDSLDLPVSMSMTLAHGDSLLITLRGHTVFSPFGRWVEMWDLLRIQTEIVPSPATGLVLLTAAFLAHRRRPITH